MMKVRNIQRRHFQALEKAFEKNAANKIISSVELNKYFIVGLF